MIHKERLSFAEKSSKTTIRYLPASTLKSESTILRKPTHPVPEQTWYRDPKIKQERNVNTHTKKNMGKQNKAFVNGCNISSANFTMFKFTVKTQKH